jgi:hypothetical protein
MRLIEQLKKWLADRKERRFLKLTGKAKKELKVEDQYDLIFLCKKGYIRTSGIGRSITKIYAKFENLVDQEIKVVVKPGTYFISRGKYQNMVIRKEYTFILDPLSHIGFTFEATCINASLPIPGEYDKFSGVRKVSNDLVRFLEVSRYSNSMVVQAGVWAITDNYNSQQIRTRLVSNDRYGMPVPAISDNDIKEAKKILKSLEINNQL